MHDLKHVVDNIDLYKKNLGKRKFDVSIFDGIKELAALRKSYIFETENLKAQINKLSQEIGLKKKSGQNADQEMNLVADCKAKMSALNGPLEESLAKLNYELSVIPNLLAEEVPVGHDDSDNVEVKSWGTPQKFSFKPKDHADLGEALGMLDFSTAAKLSGSRFVFYKKDLARLERALMNFMLDFHHKNNYQEVIPPYIVSDKAMYGTGQLPKFKEDVFKIEGQEAYLISTSEIPLTNMKADELFPMDELPLRYCSFTPCFRSEAGSYGRDTKGLIRLHQFNKVEMVQIVAEEESEKAHQEMLGSACQLLELLKLPYRAMLLCSGDIGFSARKCFDLEVWVPSQEKYREISSISNCWDFQARRANIRYRNKDGKPVYAHTLNGSGLAVGRTVVAIMENYQQEDGSIMIPEVLIPYMGGQTQIKMTLK
jgi:seryl-tRNA synthetase